MQPKNWDDLRYLLAVQRTGSLTGAARRLGVDPTTVSRRLDGLQAALSVSLVQRQGDGRLQLTEQGEAVADHAERMEHHADLIDRGLAVKRDPYAGNVRLTSVPIVVNRILLPNLAPLVARYPALTLELRPDSRNYSLTRREADLALRLSRPRTGGTQVKARRIADLPYAAYRSARLEPEATRDLPWISFDEAMAHVPQARWIARHLRGQSHRFSTIRVGDGESGLEAVLAGLGTSLIPVMIGDRDERLTRVEDDAFPPALSRELWLLAHGELLERPYVRAVVDWLDALFA